MTKAIYLEDSYKKEEKATVISVKDEKFIVLDKTIFYPNSGGQLYDTGKITRIGDGEEFKVVYVGKFSLEISHEVDRVGLKQGDEVFLTLDWGRRYFMMRSHSAAHVVSAVLYKDSKAMITGNQLGLEHIRIDFSTKEFDKEKLRNCIEHANNLINQNMTISAKYVPFEELESNPSLVKLAKGLPPGLKEVRLLSIGEYDTQADGGTHVKNTSEIGRLKFEKAENKGKTFRRMYFKVCTPEESCI